MLGSLLPRPSNAINVDTSTWGVWPGDEPGQQRVDRDTAMQLLAVYGSVRLITDGISTLPVDVFTAGPDGPVEAPRPGWLDAPWSDLDYPSWCGQVLTSLLLDGNAYLSVMRDPVGRVVQAQPLDPARMKVERPDGRRLVYRYNGFEVRSGLVHIRGLMLPGSDVGLSPVEYARRTLTLGLNAVDYGAEFFGGEGNMPGVIELPGDAHPDTMDNLAKQWQKKRRKGGKGLPGVLKGGAQWKPTGVNHEQAQFLATRQFSASEIAGQMFLVDPAELGIPVSGTSLTYANQQDRNTRRVQVTFLPWIVRLEQAFTTLAADDEWMKLNVNGLLRGDQKARYESYQTGLTHGFLDVNEVRAWEELPPLPEALHGATPREIAELIQKIYLGVDVVLSAEEAREIANRAGAALTADFEPSAATPRRRNDPD